MSHGLTHQNNKNKKKGIKKETKYANLSQGEKYGLVKAAQGGYPAAFKIELIATNDSVIATTSGKLKFHKQIIRVGDYVMIDDGNQIQFKYSESEVIELERSGLLKRPVKQAIEDCGVVFENDLDQTDEDKEIDIGLI